MMKTGSAIAITRVPNRAGRRLSGIGRGVANVPLNGHSGTPGASRPSENRAGQGRTERAYPQVRARPRTPACDGLQPDGGCRYLPERPSSEEVPVPVVDGGDAGGDADHAPDDEAHPERAGGPADQCARTESDERDHRKERPSLDRRKRPGRHGLHSPMSIAEFVTVKAQLSSPKRATS